MNTSRPQPYVALLLALGSFLSGALTEHAAAQNILLVIADDLGVDSLSLYNTNTAASLPPTPNIDALAARGVRFTNAYGYPVCSPTRAATLTGRYGFRTGVTTVLDAPGAQGIYTNELTLPEILVTTHRCASIGKWHLGGTATAPNVIGGWPHFSGSLGGGLGADATNYSSWTKTSNGVSRMNHPVYATTDNVNDALSWITAQDTNRWFLWLAFNAPHTPFHKPPSSLCPTYAALSGTAQDTRQNPRPYFEAAIEAMDTELGRLLAGIDTSNTTIFFLGDNGTMGRVMQPPYSSARGKDTLYEGGVRLPLLAAGPAVVNPGRASDAVVHVVDLFSTFLELGGHTVADVLPPPLTNDSRSLMPILRDQTFEPAEDTVLMENSDTATTNARPGRAARRGDYKLIQFTDQTEEFYNLATDPLEQTNLLSGALESPQTLQLESLRRKLDAWSNVPVIHEITRGDDGFGVGVGWFANFNFSLWRADSLAVAPWTRLTNATIQTAGAWVYLADPTPPSASAYYRVRQE